MRTPRSVDLDITSRCNLSCLYCYYYDNPAVDYVDLPTADWLKFFAELCDLAVMNVTLAGGEPFIRRDLPELLGGIVANRMRFSILSNGTLINDEIAAFIADTGRCDYVQVSIDGSCPETHDACRGSGTFKKAVDGIRTLQRHGVPVAVRVTIHHYNVHDLEHIARFLIADLGLHGFGTNSAGYIGSCRLNAQEVLLTVEDRVLAMRTLLQLNERYKGRISAAAGPLAEAQHWHKMEAARLRNDPTFPNGGRLTGCGCYNNKINILADGTITPCTMLAHIALGKINRDSLHDVWLHSPELNRLRMRHTIALEEFEFCTGCPYIPYCTGNCPGMGFNLTGKVNHPSPDACLRKFLAERGTLP